MAGYAILLAYGLAINLVCLLARRAASGDDYLIGGRSFSSLFVSFGLFTLLGGGTFVANTSLGHVFGVYGFSLFIGNGLGFVALGLLAGRIRDEYTRYKPISIPDFLHQKYGSLAGWIGFFVSFLAFFGLLVLQFTAAGDLLAPIIGLSHDTIVIAVGLIASSYLILSGFRAVMGTDLLQGVIIVVLVPTLTLIAKPASVPSTFWFPSAVDWTTVAGLAISGFISAMASADVWQRAFAAKDERVARTGFLIGSAVISYLGFMLVLLGVFAAAAGSPDPDGSFSYMMAKHMPAWASVLISLMVLSVIVSTIDTEIFLLGGLAERQLARLRRTPEEKIAEMSRLGRSRGWVALCALCAVVSAIFLTNLVTLYGWLLSLSLIIGPVCLGGLITSISKRTASLILAANTVAFIVAAILGYVTVDNSYVIALPSTLLIILIAMRRFSAKTGEVRDGAV